MEKNFYDQTIDSDIKRYKQIRKVTGGQGEYYTTGCLLDYDYIKNHYKLIAVHFSRQKESDADPEANQQIELIAQLKKLDVESMFILTILGKSQRIEIKVFSRKCNIIIKNSKLSRSES